MSQFTFLHEVNDVVYGIVDCDAGSSDAIRRGEVISLSFVADETDTASSFNAYTMTYNIRFNGDTFITAIEVPFTVTTAQSLIDGEDETSYTGIAGSPTIGSFGAGSGFVASDTITLSDGSVVTVDTVAGSPAGAVTEFTVASSGATVVAGTALTQLSTSGVGVGFTLTPDVGNLTNAGFLIAETEDDSTLFAEKADAVVAYAADLA